MSLLSPGYVKSHPKKKENLSGQNPKGKKLKAYG
jgi:hypothetical protein